LFLFYGIKYPIFNPWFKLIWMNSMSSPKTHGKKFWSLKAPEAPPFLNLGKQGNRLLATAIPTIDAQLVPLALQEKLATKVSLAILDNRVLLV